MGGGVSSMGGVTAAAKGLLEGKLDEFKPGFFLGGGGGGFFFNGSPTGGDWDGC
jgi:hypothetical protein